MPVKTEKRKLPLRAYLLYLLLLSLMLTGVTFSSYVTSSGNSDSARVAKLGRLYLTENGAEYTGDVSWKVQPGVAIVKNPVVHFESSELACYVFFTVDAEGFALTDGEYCSENGYLTFRVADDWDSFTHTDGSTVYYALAPANAAVEKAVIANGGKIAVSSDMTHSDLAEELTPLSIEIKATAVQFGGFDTPAAAYAAVR